VLGALIVALLVRRRALPPSWRRGLLTNLLFLLLLQLAVEWKVEFIDHAAHLGGLLSGILLGLLLVPRQRPARLRVGLALALAVAALGYGAVGALTCDPAVTLRKLPRQTVRWGELTLEAPRYWKFKEKEDAFDDPMDTNRVLSRHEYDKVPPEVRHLERSVLAPDGRMVSLHFYVQKDHVRIYEPLLADITGSVRFR